MEKSLRYIGFGGTEKFFQKPEKTGDFCTHLL